MYIDSHTHLYSEAFENDVDQVVEQAISQGVERFFCPRWIPIRTRLCCR